MDPRTQLTALANEQLENRDFQMAIKILNTTIRLEPDKYEHYLERSSCHLKLGNYQSSLDDCNTAIRLNSNDPAVHYSKGLALIGLSMFSEAIVSFKKAIELRAKQENSKLSDIFILLKEALGAIREARQGRKASPQSKSETVHSTTDRPANQPETSSINHNQTMTSIEALMRVSNTNCNNNLVAPNHNQTFSGSIQMSDGNNSISTNRVSSSAGHASKQPTSTNMKHEPVNIYSSNINNNNNNNNNINNNVRNMNAELLMHQSNQQLSDEAKSAQAFEWNIRRSERIFLHKSSESGVPGVQYAIISRPPNEPLQPGMTIGPQRLATNSNPSSIDSANDRSATKHVHDNSEPQHTYQQTKVARTRDDANTSYAESDVDVVDDAQHYNQAMIVATQPNIEDQSGSQKRLMVAPSSSMPATSHGPSTSASTKDDSYSTKYKRLRRDRERARRGTSKLCTIKQGDLDELMKPSASGKRSMRVIAPIDGWLYSGQLSVDDSSTTTTQFVVKLDGDATGSSYLFTTDTVLNDVIKEVRVKSVSELRKGARICCYWSRQYKCLSTGVVTSRTFEATKSLVSVKYDNGDLSALPLEDLRLLPPDYPKYMSNCDPLLLARNGDGAHTTTTAIPPANSPSANQNFNREAPVSQPVDSNLINANGIESVTKTYSKAADVDQLSARVSHQPTDGQEVMRSAEAADVTFAEEQASTANQVDRGENTDLMRGDLSDDDATIPPTYQTIDFITNETLARTELNNHSHITMENGGTMSGTADLASRVSIHDNSTLANDQQQSHLEINNSRSSSEENNFGIGRLPWVFDGVPKRVKINGRKHATTTYSMIRRGSEVIKVGDSAELIPKDQSALPFVAKIDGFWVTERGEMMVRARWYYRLEETKGEPVKLEDVDNALFETAHTDDNDVQSIYRSIMILPWTDYRRLKQENGSINGQKIYYLAGHYDPVRKRKYLRSDVKETQQLD